MKKLQKSIQNTKFPKNYHLRNALQNHIALEKRLLTDEMVTWSNAVCQNFIEFEKLPPQETDLSIFIIFIISDETYFFEMFLNNLLHEATNHAIY